MPNTKLGKMQFQFAELVWHYAPLPSGELARICQQELNWKKSTTYTVLRKLCEKGLFKNEDELVSVLMTREQFFAAQSERFVEEAFGGSLPAFIAVLHSVLDRIQNGVESDFAVFLGKSAGFSYGIDQFGFVHDNSPRLFFSCCLCSTYT